jgi:hypothetical protein
MDKTESLKLYVLGTMLVTLGLKGFSSANQACGDRAGAWSGCREEFAAVW